MDKYSYLDQILFQKTKNAFATSTIHNKIISPSTVYNFIYFSLKLTCLDVLGIQNMIIGLLVMALREIKT